MKQLIDKAAVVEEIERRLEKIANASSEDNRELSAIHGAQIYELINLAKYINTLEVKEVDLNRESAWKPANGNVLPEIDREVIALLEDGKVVFAHRPPEYWDGKNIITNEVTRHYPKRYDGGGWNQPNVKWWLDLEFPKMEG